MFDEDDRSFFRRVMDKLAYPQGHPQDLDFDFLPAIDLSVVASSEVDTGALKKGLVMEESSRLLEGKLAPLIEKGVWSNLFAALDYARVSRRNQLLSKEYLEWYSRHKVQPLQCEAGIEAFWDIIAETETKLRQGFLRCPWEVELNLLSCDKVSPSSYDLRYPANVI